MNFSIFFRTEAYNKPLKITFSHQNYFFPLIQYRIDWKIPTTKILGKLGAVPKKISERISCIFILFFKVRLIISPSNLHFLTQIILFHWPSIILIRKYHQKKLLRKLGSVHSFYKKQFPVFLYFIQIKAYNKPFKITFSHQMNFLHWPSSRLIGKYQQKSSCGN